MAAAIDFETGNRIAPEPRPALTLISEGNGQIHQSRTNRPLDPVFLYRRLLVAVILLVVAAGGLVTARSIFATVAGPPPTVVTHVVTPGESLWSIAQSAKPGGDPRHTIDEIVDVNSTKQHRFDPFESLSVGQEILIPING